MIVPPTVKVEVTQVMCALVTLAVTEPLGLTTVQIWLGFTGWLSTVTE